MCSPHAVFPRRAVASSPNSAWRGGASGRTLNLSNALGVLLLLGIVEKNGTCRVDYTNMLREQGLPLRKAIVQANHGGCGRS